MIERYNAIDQSLLLRIQSVAESFVKNARINADFTDRSTNLRSSIGYIILKNGATISENFEQKKNGADGVQEAKKVADDLKKKYPRGYVLIGVAGMEYAAAVESRGYDVITSSATTAANSLKTSLQQLANKLK